MSYYGKTSRFKDNRSATALHASGLIASATRQIGDDNASSLWAGQVQRWYILYLKWLKRRRWVTRRLAAGHVLRQASWVCYAESRRVCCCCCGPRRVVFILFEPTVMVENQCEAFRPHSYMQILYPLLQSSEVVCDSRYQQHGRTYIIY